ncbi:hypothetical protein FM037_00265 [Shewanella psychropiezotolerans]|uniref:PilZ domain-containing protein n=1 Tax=Shewanella psychropiezotolerans TaxID=2593655 RepID=A0ABX5WU74_9GAMM|nr:MULTISPECIES: hypothetical protein [Shewanella]MPY25257.1 hypothetical protein [Shewanella sp. YLB-07]QDO81932.1 hypothetical protein FM037_00265 [Shewanella psychropiezotolerans]
MMLFEEFIPADKKQQPKESDSNLRLHTRLSLRANEEECLTLACDGVTVDLIRKSWWRKHKLGVANIKDIGLGGLGLLTTVPLTSAQEIHIEYLGSQLKIRVARSWPINSRLHFVGATWVTQDENEIITMLNIITPHNTYKSVDI